LNAAKLIGIKMRKIIISIIIHSVWLIPNLGFSQIPTIRSFSGDGKNVDWPKIKADTEKEEKAAGGGPGFYNYDCDQGVNPISASSTLANQGKYHYKINNINDADPMTAWIEGKQDYGIGEYFEIKAAGINVICNGYQASPKAWIENSRVKKFKVYKNNVPLCFLELADEMGRLSFELPDYKGYNRKKESVYKFEIVDVYKGTKWKDVGISEIDLGLCCVAESSTIKTSSEQAIIANVNKGFTISTINTSTGELSNAEVLKVFKQRHLSLLKINCGTKEIQLTYNHPLYIKDFGFSSINRYMEVKNLKNYEDLINRIELGVWDESKNQIIFEKLENIEIITGVFETITIGKLTRGNTFITNGFISRVY
jgi:hypothetical protein